MTADGLRSALVDMTNIGVRQRSLSTTGTLVGTMSMPENIDDADTTT
jgi:hypothetical protein